MIRNNRFSILDDHLVWRSLMRSEIHHPARAPEVAGRAGMLAQRAPLTSSREPPVPQSWTMATIFTIGHSTRPITEFIALLKQVDVDLLVDVRSAPRSRTNPQFNADALPISLAAADITYCHLWALGGLRHRRRDAPPSPNTLWRNLAFRNYADYAATDAFRLGLDQLRALAREHRCAIMCAEAVWWRCHRRIITDYLLAEGVSVAHVMGHGKVALAKPTPGVRSRPDGTLVYPAAGDEDARQRSGLLVEASVAGLV
jgi:hypothetical protein